MKTMVCRCKQCRAHRYFTRVKKNKRIQTYQKRAAKAAVRRLLKRVDPTIVEDILPEKVSVDYYA